MPITNLSGIIAGNRAPEELLKVGGAMEAAGVLHSLLYTPGMPGAGAAPAPGINGAALTNYPGQIPFTNPSVGGQLTYLTKLACSATTAGMLRVLDRLWHNSGLVVTTLTAQAITPVAIPPRDRGGAAAGVGVSAALEVSSGTTNAAPVTTITASYTNSAGVAGRVAVMAVFPTTALAGTLVPFALQAGDVGIRSVESVTLGTSLGAGAVHLVLYRSLAALSVPTPNVSAEFNAFTGGMPVMHNDSVPFLAWLPASAAASVFSGQYATAQG